MTSLKFSGMECESWVLSLAGIRPVAKGTFPRENRDAIGKIDITIFGPAAVGIFRQITG
jgi:hypothetical protein